MDYSYYTQTTTQGIDRLAILVRFMPLLSSDNHEAGYSRFTSFLESELKREITPEEQIALCEGVLQYIRSEPGTNERLKAMKYLFGLEFLQTEATGSDK